MNRFVKPQHQNLFKIHYIAMINILHQLPAPSGLTLVLLHSIRTRYYNMAIMSQKKQLIGKNRTIVNLIRECAKNSACTHLDLFLSCSFMNST